MMDAIALGVPSCSAPATAMAKAAVIVEMAPIKDDAMPARSPCVANPPTVALPNTKPKLEIVRNSGTPMAHTPPIEVKAKKKTRAAKHKAA